MIVFKSTPNKSLFSSTNFGKLNYSHSLHLCPLILSQNYMSLVFNTNKCDTQPKKNYVYNADSCVNILKAYRWTINHSLHLCPLILSQNFMSHGLIQTSVTHSQKRITSITLIAVLIFLRHTVVLYETFYLGIFLWITFPMTLCHTEVSLKKVEIVERPKIWVSRKDGAS